MAGRPRAYAYTTRKRTGLTTGLSVAAPAPATRAPRDRRFSAQGLCHADIKPENMLLTEDGHVKLVDFGLSCEISKGEDKSEGTLGYWAPEVLRTHRYALPMDMWALGVVLYVLLQGEHPFDDAGTADNAKLKLNIRTKKPSFDSWSGSAESRKLVSRVAAT